MRNNGTKGWNFFARELEVVLANHNIQLSYLHEEAAIFPDKVRRLVLSLAEPGSFPVLREDELIALEKACRLTSSEMLQLRAAFLATSIEKGLVESIGIEGALQAAQAIFPVIFASLQQVADETKAEAKGDTYRGDLFLGKNNKGLEILEKAWKACDSAEIVLQLSYTTDTPAERIMYMHQTVEWYEEALRQMEQADKTMRRMSAWKDWYTEIQRNSTAAKARLESLKK